MSKWRAAGMFCISGPEQSSEARSSLRAEGGRGANVQGGKHDLREDPYGVGGPQWPLPLVLVPVLAGAVFTVGVTVEREFFESDAPLEHSFESPGLDVPVRQHYDTVIQSDIAYQGSKVDPRILGGQRTSETGDLLKATDDDMLVEATRSWLPPGFGDEREVNAET